ncbi:MAG: hypothetical protein M3O71_28800 [Bacteroidota bacterium]|nr:hypothetical protein [Bacteroidota bacterium]
MKTLPLLIAFCCIIRVYGQETILYPALKKQVDSLALLDKIAGHNNMTGFGGNRDSLNKVFRQVTVSNTRIIKGIFEKYGFLSYKMVGKEASNSFWLMVQHADNDLPFQEAVLKKMKLQVDQKNADGANFAYLADRVNINSGRPQIYGTQLSRAKDANGRPIPKDIIDPENVNKRRQEVGLEPLEKYLDFVKEATTKHN